MPAFIPPSQPDASFAMRFNKTYKYGFCMLYDGETAAQLDFSGSENASPGRYVVLNINPQSVNLSEPFATSVRLAQAGGKIIESRGQVLKHGTIAGQTGYLPAAHNRSLVALPTPKRRQLVPEDPDLERKLAAISGFKAFHDLRYLFRLYGFERLTGRTDVKFYYFDFKNDDFWRIEPDVFNMSRSARKPFTYDYNITFKCIQLADNSITDNLSEKKADTHEIPVKFLKPASSSAGYFASVQRLATMVTSALDYTKHVAGVVQRAVQVAARAINNVVGFFENFHDTATILLETALVLLAQADNTLSGVFDTIDLYAPDNVKRELNEWALEAEAICLHMADTIGLRSERRTGDVLKTSQQFASGRMKGGAKTDLMTLPAGGTTTPDANPFTGSSGLGLVTNIRRLAATKAFKTVAVHDGDTIFSVAKRTLGDSNRFVDLVILNDLAHPYIVPNSAQRPSGTLAYGDYIMVPDTQRSGVGDSPAASSPTESGAVSMLGLSNQVIDRDRRDAWREDQWIGYTVTCTTGAVVEERVVIANTGDTLTVNIAWVTPLTLATTYTITMKTFDPRKPVTNDARAFGTDLLVRFDAKGKCDLVFNSRKDLVWITGQDNFMQALMIRLSTEIGSHPFHPDYGTEHPIGRAVNADVALFYSYFIRRSLLSDPRTQAVRNAQISFIGDKYNFSAQIQPIKSVKARPVQVTLG